MAGLDCLAMPSFNEGLPYTLLEAMHLGLPIVASRVGGIPEIVTPGVTGELVPPGDPFALANTITALLGDLQTMARMREGAFTHADQFSTKAWVQRLSAVYSESPA
jgi:glycosyltransferase involved in cell wall biosynthesis